MNDHFKQGMRDALDGVEKKAELRRGFKESGGKAPDLHAALMEKPGFLSLWNKRSTAAAHTRELLGEMIRKKEGSGWKLSGKRPKMGTKLNFDVHPTTYAREFRQQSGRVAAKREG